MAWWKRIAGGVVLTFGLVGCQTNNSDAQDADTYSNIGGSVGFAASRAIFASACANCHDYHTKTEDQLKSDGVLVGGSPTSSKLYYRLQGAPGGNMPQGGSISADDVKTISDWITAVP